LLHPRRRKGYVSEGEGEGDENVHGNRSGSDESVFSEPTPKLPEEKLLMIERIWGYYIQKLGKNSKLLSFTALRKQKGLARLNECLAKSGGDLKGAEGLMCRAVDALAASGYHRGENASKTKYDSWESNLFKSQEQLEKWLDSTCTGKQAPLLIPKHSSNYPILEVSQ
jgi:hypothetical protein